MLGHVLRGYVQQQDVDDVLQDTFIRFFTASRRQTVRFPKAFLAKTATNLALNHTSKACNARTGSIEDFSSSEVSASSQDIEIQLDSEERFKLFCRAVEKLPTQCRQAFLLRKVYGLSQREIAEELRISESTVEKHIAKGLFRCRKYMGKTGMPGV